MARECARDMEGMLGEGGREVVVERVVWRCDFRGV